MMHYLDNAATTPVREDAARAAYEAMTAQWGNPSARYALGSETAGLVKGWRKDVAKALGCGEDELIFTSCGTESDNWAIRAAVEINRRKGKHIITTAIEHSAVLEPCRQLEKQGYEVTYLQPDREGNITAAQVEEALREDTVLVSMMLVNNEVGSVLPVAEVSKLLKRKKSAALLHCDAVQGFLKIPFQAKTLGADLITVSSHKVHGPKGAGALYISPRLGSFPALLLGGGQESGYRSGTEATPSIFVFAAACCELSATFREDAAREKALLDGLVEKLCKLDGVVINGCHDAPHILSLSIPGIPTQNTINYLQEDGICVSAGSACAKGHRSHVLTAMKLSPEIMDGSFRVSISRETTEEELNKLVECIQEKILPKVRK